MDVAMTDADEKIEVLPTTETDVPNSNDDSSISEEQWSGMRDVLQYLYDYREEDGHDPSRVFHKRVNKRNVPSYYEVIKEPMAFSNLKASSINREYKSFKDFVRDCALIWHNAHTYNRPDAGAYQDASTIKRLMEEQLQKLVDQGLITQETATWPDLGEIPPVEDLPPDEEDDEEEGGDEDADGEDDDEDDEADDSDEEGPRKRRSRPGRPSRRDTKDATEPETKKRRGRPPKVDTPMEARIKNVLKGLRKPKSDDGVIMIHTFEKLPDKAAMPEYYAEIRNPIAIEQIKKNQKRKRYHSVDHFMRDVDLMFENAKLFNEDDSQIFKDAVFLQAEAHKIAELEKKKSDDEFVMEEGRKPRPGGITQNGELWKVGDWVHIKNANDISKPIVAQLYRTWEDANGSEWVNACWYYRPEQTVHHYEKHFFPGEVVKTGQYRDHPIEDVIDRCFVMFFTRFSRGRPRGLAPDRDVYVCEARYNEEKHKMNKIKTWASCLPDEVRDKDYEMDMFDGIRKVKKVPSPLLYMLKEDEKDGEESSKPRWGAENAPPIVGGIYKGPRDENQSPPPEPTPSPPPQPPPQPPRQATQTPNHDDSAYRRAQELLGQAGRPFGQPPEGQAPNPHQQQQQASFTPQPRHYSQTATSNTPQQYQQTPSHPQTHPMSYTPQPPQSAGGYQPLSNNTYADHYATPSQNRFQPPQQTPRYPSMNQPLPAGQRPETVFVLPDSANAIIPEDVRARYRTDEVGRILFFDKPPLDVLPPTPEGAALGHSLKYRAAMIKRKMLQKERRKEEEAKIAAEANKRLKVSSDHQDKAANLAPFELAVGMSFTEWVRQMNRGTETLNRAAYRENWDNKGKEMEAEQIRAMLRRTAEKTSNQTESEIKRHEDWLAKEIAMWKGPKVYLDDVNPRI